MAAVPVDRLEAGMTVATDVRDPLGRLLVAAGTVVTERHSRILVKWGIGAVEIVTGAGQEAPAASPELVAAAREEVGQRFRWTDREHPFVHELFQQVVERRARQLAGEELGGS